MSQRVANNKLDKKFNKLFSDLRVKVEKIYRYHPESSIVVAKCLYENHFVLIKTVAHSNKRMEELIEKEIEADRFIKKFNKISTAKIDFVDILKSGSAGVFFWIIRNYYKGDALSETGTGNDLTLWGHDIIKNKYLRQDQSIISQIVIEIKLFAKINKKIIKDKGYPISISTRFKSSFENKNLSLIEGEIGFSLKKQLDFFNKNKKNYFSQKNIRTCIGDFIPSNILVTDDKQIKLSDFSFFCLDNYLLDISYFWLFLWRYPNWQRSFLSYFIKTKENQNNFRACLIREIISLGWHKRLSRANHIWLKYLKAAGESFEAIMKVKQI